PRTNERGSVDSGPPPRQVGYASRARQGCPTPAAQGEINSYEWTCPAWRDDQGTADRCHRGPEHEESPRNDADTGKLAALLASDRVRMVTGTTVNSTAGSGLD